LIKANQQFCKAKKDLVKSQIGHFNSMITVLVTNVEMGMGRKEHTYVLTHSEA
jgi:hypothetical protein